MADHNLDVSEFPDFNTSPYRLQFPEGATAFLAQGNMGKFSHMVDEHIVQVARRKQTLPPEKKKAKQ